MALPKKKKGRRIITIDGVQYFFKVFPYEPYMLEYQKILIGAKEKSNSFLYTYINPNYVWSCFFEADGIKYAGSYTIEKHDLKIITPSTIRKIIEIGLQKGWDYKNKESYNITIETEIPPEIQPLSLKKDYTYLILKKLNDKYVIYRLNHVVFKKMKQPNDIHIGKGEIVKSFKSRSDASNYVIQLQKENPEVRSFYFAGESPNKPSFFLK